MKKILIAITDDFTRKVYSKVFSDENFKVLETKSGKEALDLAKKEIPDITLADVSLSEIDGLELLKSLKKETLTQKIPVIIFTQTEREGDKIKAIELEARDFIVGILIPPPEVVLKVKVHLGEEKTYQLVVDRESKEVQDLAKDLGYDPNLLCSRCKAPIRLFLIRDLSRGKNYFKASFICPECH
jgi:DNA-binding response OmpR family regulator